MDLDIDDETLLIIEESNVSETLNDVIIYEEQIKDDSVLILNKDQITHELTNLLINEYKNAFKTQKKVNMYIDLFDSIDTNDNILIDNIKPIIYCKKFVVLHDTKDDKYSDVDQEFQDTYALQTQSFQTYMGQFRNLNTDKTNSYLHSANALYSLSKPFANTNNNTYISNQIISNQDEDVFRHFLFEEFNEDDLKKARVNKYETFRVLKPSTVDIGKKPEVPDDKPGCTSGLHYISASNNKFVYEGDKIDIVGYVSICNNNLDQISFFNIKSYFEQLKKLSIKSKVTIFFNDFAFDSTGKIITQIEGVVTLNNKDYIIIKPHKKITINGIQLDDIKVNFDKPNYCFVYDVKYKGYQFNRQHLKTNTIVFTLFNDSNTTLSIIKPNSVSELLFINIDVLKSITNIFELKKLVNDVLNIDFDKITLNIQRILYILLNIDQNLPKRSDKLIINDYHISNYSNNIGLLDFNKYNKFLKSYKQSYNAIRTFRDSTLNRYAYLLDKNDYGYVYILQVLKDKIQNKHKYVKTYEQVFVKQLDVFKTQLDKVDKQLSQLSQSSKKDPPKIIAKEYMTLEDLDNDNQQNGNLYFDKHLDHTKYDLKNKVNKSLIGNEQKYALVDLLGKDDEFSKKTRDELEIEATTIINGKKLVRDGHYAILHLPNGHNILYLRKNISGTQTWIKIFKTPFKICTDNLNSFDELQNENSIILDPFELLCKKQKDVKLSIIKHILNQQISAIESIIIFINDIDNIIDLIDTDIEIYKKQFDLFKNESLFSLQEVRRSVNVKLPENHEKSNIYEDYIGNEDLLDLDAIFGNTEFGENYTTLNTYTHKEDSKLQENEDILKTFIKILDIDISEPVYNYILQQILAAYPLKDLTETINKKETKLNTVIQNSINKNKQLYDTNKDYRAKVDALIKKIKDDHKEFEIKEFKKYYANVIIYTASILILVIMIEYPTIVINKLIPKCVGFFSYIGYPLSSNSATQSLSKYFACIIGSIGTPGDLQFDQFSKMSTNEIESEIVNSIDSIKEINFNISETLEHKKELLQKIKHKFATDFSLYNTLNESFKPNFEFKDSKKSDPIINYLSEINNIIHHAKILKYSNNISSLINSCCVEKLTNTINFYDFLKNETNFKNIYDKIHKISNDFVITRSLLPVSQKFKTIDIFKIKTIDVPNTQDVLFKERDIFLNTWNNINNFININNLIKEDIIFKNLIKNFEDIDGWWSNTFYTHLDSNLIIILKYIKKYYELSDPTILEQFKLIITGKSFSKSDSLRASIFSFIKFRLPTILSRIVNQKIISESKGGQGSQNKDNKDDSVTLLIKLQDTIINNSNFEPILLKYKSSAFVRNIDDLFFAQTQINKKGNETDNGKDKDETLITLNISLLSYLLIKLMTNILYITLYDDINIDPAKLDSITLKLNTIQKQNQRISCHIVYYIIDDFIKYIAINDTDNDKIKKRVEELREKRKQEMIAEYSSDAEKRKMQMLLKKMGLKIDDPDDLNKDDEKEKNNEKSQVSITQNLSAYDNEQQENENYNITYQGDNADGDEIEEDYFVNQETEFE